MKKADCPNRNALQSLLDEVEAQEGEEFLGHLEGCTACQHSLETLAGDPAAWLVATAGLGKTVRYEAALLDVVERLKDEDLFGEDDDDLSFLQPTDKPGLLGLLGDYEVQEQIGRGGMGIVLKATDPGLSRTVAIKVMSPKLAASATARRRFVREGRAVAKVVHDHIVTVHGVQEAGGLPYLIMQHVEGESLQDRLDREGPLESNEIVRIAQQAAAGLAAAHAQGLIHRDIKPANLLLEVPRAFPFEAAENEGRVKITDFGLARMVDDVQMTQHGMVIGTPEYMAPEQARGEAVDHRADLFSLGSVMYAMCTDRPPFRGSSTVAVLRQVSDDTPAAVRSVNPEIPEWLADIVERLMRKNPSDRFQGAAEVAASLAGFLAQERDPHRPAPIAASSLRKRRRPVRSFAWLAIAIALALVPVSLWLLRPHFPGAAPEPLAAQPSRPAADEKKEQPAGDEKKGDVRAQVPPAKGDIGDAERKLLVPRPVPPTPEQLRAIAILKRLNAKFKFDEPGRPIVHVNFVPGTVVDDVLEELLPLQDIGVMGLQGTQISDAGLKHVAGFKKMFQLYLGQTKISDVGLKELANHPRLEHLGLENTRITDEGIHSLAPLKTLKYLNVGGTAITDGCLKDVGGFRQMEMLCLYSTSVTDSGMKELKGLTKLRTLLLNDTGVTNAGIKELAPLTQLKRINAANTVIDDVGLNALKETVPAVKFEAPVAAEGPPATDPYLWLTAAGLVLAVIALSFAGVLVFFRMRQEASKAPSSPENLQKEKSSPAPPHPIAMVCPNCQRKLRAKAQQAGKSVKCPGCGSPVDVPLRTAGWSPVKSARPKD